MARLRDRALLLHGPLEAAGVPPRDGVFAVQRTLFLQRSFSKQFYEEFFRSQTEYANLCSHVGHIDAKRDHVVDSVNSRHFPVLPRLPVHFRDGAAQDGNGAHCGRLTLARINLIDGRTVVSSNGSTLQFEHIEAGRVGFIKSSSEKLNS